MATKRTRIIDVGFLKETDSEPDLSAMFARGLTESTPVEHIAPDRLLDNPYQPRIAMDAASISELAGVIREQGFQGALVARPIPNQPGTYQLAFGHRRREAAKKAGLATIPIMIRPIGEEEMAEIAITENIQRADLTPLEEGKTFDMMNTVMGYTYEQIAASIGKTRGYVENRLRAARAPADVQALVADKPDSLRAVATLIKIQDPVLRGEMIAQLRTGRLTADDLAGYLPGADPQTPQAGADTGVPVVVAPTPDRRPGPRTSEAITDEQIQARQGHGHLTAAGRALDRFQRAAQARDQISLREFTQLAALRRQVEQLYAQYSPVPDTE